MEQLVEEQETMVEVIDQRGDEIQTNVNQAQEQIGQAVEKARSRRRKKWWCLLVVRKFTLSDPCLLLRLLFIFFHGTSLHNYPIT